MAEKNRHDSPILYVTSVRIRDRYIRSEPWSDCRGGVLRRRQSEFRKSWNVKEALSRYFVLINSFSNNIDKKNHILLHRLVLFGCIMFFSTWKPSKFDHLLSWRLAHFLCKFSVVRVPWNLNSLSYFFDDHLEGLKARQCANQND